jgi:hypothetical protein
MNREVESAVNSLIRGLEEVFTSQNEMDSIVDGIAVPPANMTDGLFEIARSIRFLARQVEDWNASYRNRHGL